MKSKEFPYKKFQTTKAWNVVESAIKELAANNDIVETTDRSYIVGFILKQLDGKKLLKD